METVNTVSLLVTAYDIVVTSCILFVSVQARKLTYSAVPPLSKKSFVFSGPRRFVFSVGVLPVCLNVVFLSLPRSFTAALLCSLLSKKGHRTVIFYPAGHSVVTGFRATKKAGTQMRTDFPQKDRPIHYGCGFTFM